MRGAQDTLPVLYSRPPSHCEHENLDTRPAPTVTKPPKKVAQKEELHSGDSAKIEAPERALELTGPSLTAQELSRSSCRHLGRMAERPAWSAAVRAACWGAAPAASADENGRLPLGAVGVRHARRRGLAANRVNVNSADVRMSVGQAAVSASARGCALPPRVGRLSPTLT